MDKEKLEQYLRNRFSKEVNRVKPTDAWWANAILTPKVREHRSRSLRPVRIGMTLVLVPLILILLGTSVYGAISGVQRLFDLLARDVETAGLAQTLNLSQTIDDVTVTLEKAYADPNVILVGYTIDGPTGDTSLLGGKITTSNGQQLYPMVGLGSAPDYATLGIENSSTVWAYDASTLTDDGADLSLNLELSQILTSTTKTPEQEISDSFSFDFVIRFHDGKKLDINQTIESAGIPVTLENIVISPWATRADILIPSFSDQGTGPLPLVSLIIPDGEFATFSMNKRGETCFTSYCGGDFTKQTGQWILVVQELVFPPEVIGQESIEAHPASDSTRLIGPWVFRFNVP